MADEEFKINLPEDFEINLDESEDSEESEEDEYEEDEDSEENEEETEEESEIESIEDIVADTPTSPPPNINFSSNFAPQQFVSSQGPQISPVLEMREIPIPINLEDELPEFQTTTPETAGQQAQAYDAGSDYYADNYKPSQDHPEIQPIDPTLNQNFTAIQPRLTSSDTSWGTPRHQDWEKQYDIKFKEPKTDRRRRF